MASALSLALTNDWDLQKTAMQSKMGFVTPTNLIAILRVAESLWRQDQLSKSAEKIAITKINSPIILGNFA